MTLMRASGGDDPDDYAKPEAFTIDNQDVIVNFQMVAALRAFLKMPPHQFDSM